MPSITTNTSSPHLIAYCKISQYVKIKVTTYENTFNRECPNYEEGLSREEYLDCIVDLCEECVSSIPPVDRLEKVNSHKVFCYSTSLFSEAEVLAGNFVEQVYCVDCQTKCIQYRQLENCSVCSFNSKLFGELRT